MRDWLVAALIFGAVALVWKGVGLVNGTDDSLNPAEIKNPVYMEIRITTENARRSFEAVALVKTANDADCERLSKNALQSLGLELDRARAVPMTLKSVECKAELSPRNAQLFDNEPNVLTYISAARGSRVEREIRWIFWGVSVQESDMVCSMVPELQRNLKGKVRCIRALRS